MAEDDRQRHLRSFEAAIDLEPAAEFWRGDAAVELADVVAVHMGGPEDEAGALDARRACRDGSGR